MYPHQPVLVEEVVAGLAPRVGGIYVDGTVGSGGHAEAILRCMGSGRFVGIDRDAEILERARERLLSFGTKVTLIQGNYADLATHLHSIGIEAVDGIVLDLGLSSLQLDRTERGFSFAREAPLDMRMDGSQGSTAEDLVNTLSERQWVDLLVRFGEERFARRIARAVIQARRAIGPTRGRIHMTTQLAEIITKAVPFRGKIHPATRTFQALRIAVNNELGHLQTFLDSFPNLLAPQGRLVVISYHSLEDRLVKHTCLRHVQAGQLQRITKKPLIPTDQEVASNPRARSAKLRIVEKI